MRAEQLLIMYELIDSHVGYDGKLNDNLFLFKDLGLYGEVYFDILDNFLIKIDKKIVDRNAIKEISSLVPSEWHTILSGFFIKPNVKKDVTVAHLLEIIDQVSVPALSEKSE